MLKSIESLEMCIVVGVFSNGLKALEYCYENHVDIIFTDICMPTMTGFEFVQKLRERENFSYVVILSAYNEFNYAREALKLQVNEFVLKPEVTKECLKEILTRANICLRNREREKVDEIQELIPNVLMLEEAEDVYVFIFNKSEERIVERLKQLVEIYSNDTIYIGSSRCESADTEGEKTKIVFLRAGTAPDAEDVKGFETFIQKYSKGLEIEKAAITYLD